MRGRERERGVRSNGRGEGREFLQDWLRPIRGIGSHQGVHGDFPALEKVPGAAEAKPDWVEALGVPYRCPCSGQDVVGEDSAREGRALRFGKGTSKVPLSSARTFLSHVGCWVSRWVSGESSPKAASRSHFCPLGLPQGRGEFHPFAVTCRAASAAPAAAGCSQPKT